MNELLKRRHEGRRADELRPVKIETNVQRNAAGSVLISTGFTRVLCAASVEDRVPRWMKNQERGWVTAEYAMLPGSGDERIARRKNARAQEIQRLIGRSLRAVTNLDAIPGITITLDCDVVDADGGTRTASISGAWLALNMACQGLLEEGKIKENPLSGEVAAISVGIVDGRVLLDLDYPEDSNAEVDMNVVGTSDGKLIEVQGSAEKKPFTRQQLDEMLDMAQKGIGEIMEAQRGVE